MTDQTRLFVLLLISLALHFSVLHDWKAGPQERDVLFSDEMIYIDISCADADISVQAPVTLEQADYTPGGEQESADRRRSALKTYLEQVSNAVHNNRRVAANAQLIGSAQFRITIARNGTFSQITQTRTSGDKTLDADAYAAIKRSSCKIRRPRILGSAPIVTNITVKYQFGL
nr:TonB C-terminal domain-containing protein [uncultured Desulfobacter sp.]